LHESDPAIREVASKNGFSSAKRQHKTNISSPNTVLNVVSTVMRPDSQSTGSFAVRRNLLYQFVKEFVRLLLFKTRCKTDFTSKTYVSQDLNWPGFGLS